MTEDKINENKVLAQNGGSGTNKDEREGNAKVDRKNEAFVQASLSIFSGIVGDAAADMLTGDKIFDVIIIALIGFIIFCIVRTIS